MDPGLEAVALEHLGDLGLGPLFQQHEGLLRQGGNGHPVVLGQGVVLGENGQEPVPA